MGTRVLFKYQDIQMLVNTSDVGDYMVLDESEGFAYRLPLLNGWH